MFWRDDPLMIAALCGGILLPLLALVFLLTN
jgi:hypothetical protein